MAENVRVYSDTKEDTNQKRRTRQQDSEPLLEQYRGWDQGLLSLTETPFYPRMDQHAAFLASAPPAPPLTRFATHLQQTYGNRYVQRLVELVKVQPKLIVNTPNDIYEQEADRVAEAVTRSMDSRVHRQPEEEEEEVMPLLQRQEEKAVVTTPSSLAQRQPAEEEEEEELQAKFLLQLQEIPEEELQMESAESQPTNISDHLEKKINAARSGGDPLPNALRDPMERAFGADFSDVRVHTDSEADELNQQLSAKAFTTGQDVFFRQGEYSPGSNSGKTLIAHELTHVVQQCGGQSSVQRTDGKDPYFNEDNLDFIVKHDDDPEHHTLYFKGGGRIRQYHVIYGPAVERANHRERRSFPRESWQFFVDLARDKRKAERAGKKSAVSQLQTEQNDLWTTGVEDINDGWHLIEKSPTRGYHPSGGTISKEKGGYTDDKILRIKNKCSGRT